MYCFILSSAIYSNFAMEEYAYPDRATGAEISKIESLKNQQACTEKWESKLTLLTEKTKNVLSSDVFAYMAESQSTHEISTSPERIISTLSFFKEHNNDYNACLKDAVTMCYEPELIDDLINKTHFSQCAFHFKREILCAAAESGDLELCRKLCTFFDESQLKKLRIKFEKQLFSYGDDLAYCRFFGKDTVTAQKLTESYFELLLTVFTSLNPKKKRSEFFLVFYDDVADYTPLMLAARFGLLGYAQEFIHGCDVNYATAKHEFTALYLACERKNHELAEFLLEHGADPSGCAEEYVDDGEDITLACLLHKYLSKDDRKEHVIYVIRHTSDNTVIEKHMRQADFSDWDMEDKVAIFTTAGDVSNFDLADTIYRVIVSEVGGLDRLQTVTMYSALRHGWAVARDRGSGNDAHANLMRGEFYLERLLRVFVTLHPEKKRSDLMVSDSCGYSYNSYTALSMAVNIGSLTYAREFINSCDVNYQGGMSSALHVACDLKDKELVTLLLEHGADASEPLDWFIEYKEDDPVWAQLLYAHLSGKQCVSDEERIAKKFSEGRTCLSFAVQLDMCEEVKRLLSLKIPFDVKNRYGKTPLWYVKSQTMLKILVDGGTDINALDNSGVPIVHCLDFEHQLYLIKRAVNSNYYSDTSLKWHPLETCLLLFKNRKCITAEALHIDDALDMINKIDLAILRDKMKPMDCFSGKYELADKDGRNDTHEHRRTIMEALFKKGIKPTGNMIINMWYTLDTKDIDLFIKYGFDYDETEQGKTFIERWNTLCSGIETKRFETSDDKKKGMAKCNVLISYIKDKKRKQEEPVVQVQQKVPLNKSYGTDIDDALWRTLTTPQKIYRLFTDRDGVEVMAKWALLGGMVYFSYAMLKRR